jgi:signal transduction histidine kinase
MRLRQLTKTANFRLAAAYALLFSISVIALGAVVFLRTTSAFEEQARARIESEAGALENAFHEGGMTALIDAIKSRQRGRVVRGLVYGIVDRNAGTVVGDLEGAPSEIGWNNVVGPPDGDEAPGELEQLTVLTVELADGVWLSIGDDFGRIKELGEAMLETFGFVLLLTVVLAIAGGLYISDRVLGRISAITQTAEAIINGDIHKRIPRRAADDELDRLSATLNRMLDRIVALMDALRQVSSSIAHELRTPLSHLRQTLEVAQADVETGQLSGAFLTRAIEETDGLLNTFAALLRIAQIESGVRRQGFREIDLSAVVQSLVQTYEALAEDGGRSLTADIEPGVAVHGDGELIVQGVVNLIENALRHTPTGSSVRVSLAIDKTPLLTVADNGPGIPAGERERVLHRFERLEGIHPSYGSGLGLSIVAAIAELHDIALSLDDSHPGLKVSLRFLGRWSIKPKAYHGPAALAMTAAV